MKQSLLILLLVLSSCGKERIVQLPAIKSSQISEVLDVSPAYIFYDETQIDSVLFNRKNLIGTTNWLVNVDKRLKLKQILPHLQYLQNKRRKKGMHSNANAKNYFTCNDQTKKTLGFIEFTNINFMSMNNSEAILPKEGLKLLVHKPDHIEMGFSRDCLNRTNIHDLESVLRSFQNKNEPISQLIPVFNQNLIFQDYITVMESLEIISQSSALDIKNTFILNLDSLN